ncbi:MAG: DNA polymerase/3'-5' exonuclease PolX [Thermodesulfobacteriota bacterium]
MENIDIARTFHDIADLLEIKGENPFRVRSYRNAAQVIEGLPEPIERMVKENEGRIETIPGIGKSIHEKVAEIVRTGTCQFKGELLAELPEGLLDILQLQGVGPKKVRFMYKSLGIASVDELHRAVKAHRLHDLPGMGEKSEEKILRAIKDMKKREGRFRLSLALSYAEALIEYIREIPGVIDISSAGSLRRWRESIGDIDILVTCDGGSSAIEPVMERFTEYPDVADVIAAGGTKSSVLLKNGLQVDLRVLERRDFGAALLYFTGSKAHNIALRDRAKRMGLKVSEYGVFREGDNGRIAGESEEEVYRAIGLEWIPPELRENRGEIEAAIDGKLPRLVERKDIRGDLHMHTKASDGGSTIEEMAGAAMARGYEYIAVTDHSRALTVARGLDEKRLLRQMDEVDRINSRFKVQGSRFRILKGMEVDIKSDGSLDLDEGLLRELDVVVAAVHSKFSMGADEMTERILTAMASGVVNIIAHPTGRIIEGRAPYPVDMKRLMEGAKRHRVTLELNSYPDRLDLNDVNLRLAKETGVMVAISTDSHSAYHLENIIYGIHTARRGWLEKKDILNTRPLKELLKILKRGNGHLDLN